MIWKKKKTAVRVFAIDLTFAFYIDRSHIDQYAKLSLESTYIYIYINISMLIDSCIRALAYHHLMRSGVREMTICMII